MKASYLLAALLAAGTVACSKTDAPFPPRPRKSKPRSPPKPPPPHRLRLPRHRRNSQPSLRENPGRSRRGFFCAQRAVNHCGAAGLAVSERTAAVTSIVLRVRSAFSTMSEIRTVSPSLSGCFNSISMM